MRNLTNLTWGELTVDEKEEMLIFSEQPISGIDYKPVSNGECIIDFAGSDFSIAGSVTNDVIKIDDNAVFYNPML